jgi:hypothetical protein
MQLLILLDSNNNPTLVPVDVAMVSNNKDDNKDSAFKDNDDNKDIHN